MIDLDFRVVGVEAARDAALPTLSFAIGIAQGGERPVSIRGISLQCQIRIETTRRVYKPAEKTRLADLFGEPARWGRTLTSLLWTHAGVMVPAFERDTAVALPVPCSFDFNLATTKYLHALEYEKVPLLLLFSGTVFHGDAAGALAVQPISWNKEVRYRLPYDTWQAMMDRYYPNCAWLCLRRDVFHALDHYKRQHGLTGYDEALARLLPASDTALAS